MPERRAVMSGISGSGPFGAVAQMAWFGQPAQESALPACCDSGPGQCSEFHQHGNTSVEAGQQTWFWSDEFGGSFEGRGHVEPLVDF